MFSLGYRNHVACDEEQRCIQSASSWLGLDSCAILVIALLIV